MLLRDLHEQSLCRAFTSTSGLPRGSWGNSQIFGVEDGDVGPRPAPALPTFQKLGKFHSLSDPLSLLLENGNR